MAAYAALVSLMNDLELIPNHPTHSFSFDDKQIASLSQTVHILIHFMESYDSHGCSREAAQVLESRIASAAHAANDVIETHVVDQIHAGFTIGGKARSYFLLDLQKAINNMEFVKRKAMRFKATSGLKAEQQLTYSAPTSSEPHTSRKNQMVGYDDVVERLMEKLTGEPSGERVIPIVGMGGMGKTTLTRNVYDNLLMQEHFDIRLWATISQEYSVENILRQLLFGKSPTGGNVNETGVGLHKMLWGRRYLIVLDDMWSVEAWNEIQIFLPDNGNGSRVIVTTRLSKLAAHLSSSIFVMNFLDNDKSWELFCGKAFGEEDCPVELEEIGKTIVKRCRGLPLSIIVIGGHLRGSSRAIEYWEKVANFVNPISSIGADDQCLKIIGLSYDHLPAHLKPCFLYMGIFEEDEWIDAAELFMFWVGEGFVKAKKGMSLEEAAEDYLKDLIDRSLIFGHERWWNGKAKYCGIHDIVRELCLIVAKKEKFMCVLDTTEAIGKERRVVIPKKKLKSDVNGALESALLLRSLVGQGEWSLDALWVELRLLRMSANVIDMLLKKDGICFPAANFQQLNLRYLAFICRERTTMRRFTQRPYIPSSIFLFWNMQTLILKDFDVQITAPYEVWEMSQLRHLEFKRICLPDPSEEGSNQQECIVLQNLHTLLGVENLRLTEDVCKRMPNIKKLCLRYNHSPKANSYYCLHNLDRFNKLVSVRCEFGDDSMFPIYYNWRDVVLSLRFPSSVEELCLRDCHLNWKDLTTMIKSLTHLESLELDIVRGRKWYLVDEEFPRLKILRIINCDLVYWNLNSSHFPILEILSFWNTPKLRKIPFVIGETSTLRLFDLKGCRASAVVSAMRIVIEQESFGNDDLDLDVHFWGKEEVKTFQKMVEEDGLKNKSFRLHRWCDKIIAFYRTRL